MIPLNLDRLGWGAGSPEKQETEPTGYMYVLGSGGQRGLRDAGGGDAVKGRVAAVGGSGRTAVKAGVGGAPQTGNLWSHAWCSRGSGVARHKQRLELLSGAKPEGCNLFEV